MGIRRSVAASVVLLAGLTACASQGSAASEEGGGAKAAVASPASKSATGSMSATPATPFVWETWPPPGEVAEVARPAPTGEIVEITCPPEGMRVLDLLNMVSAKLGAVLIYDPASNTKLMTAKLQALGTWRVPRSGLLDMCRAALTHQNLMIVPVGSSVGGEVLSVLDMNNPMVKTSPTWVPENEVLGYARCDGLYIVTTFRIRDTVDTARVRNALTSLTTQTASIGRVQDVPGGRALVVGDFAPVVAVMKRIVDQINLMATTPMPPLPGAPK